MATGTKKGSEQKVEFRRPVAFLFELENSAVDGRKMLFDVCKQLLGERDAELTPELFVRYCTIPSPARFVPALLDAMGKKRLSAEKLAAEITEALHSALLGDRVRAMPSFTKLMQKMQDKNVLLGSLTALPRDTAEALLKKLGLEKFNVKIHCSAPDAGAFPTADGWLKLAKVVSVPPVGCAALATSGVSCAAAVSAGMHCVALPDEFTSYQAFSGADLLVDKLSDENVTEIQSMLIQPNPLT